MCLINLKSAKKFPACLMSMAWLAVSALSYSIENSRNSVNCQSIILDLNRKFAINFISHELCAGTSADSRVNQMKTELRT